MGSSRSPSTRSTRSPTSPTTDSERVYSNRGSSRLNDSTPLSPIKESRKETESLLKWSNSPIKESKLQLTAVPKKQSSRIRCTEKILTQLEVDIYHISKPWSEQGEKIPTTQVQETNQVPKNRQSSNGKFPTARKPLKSVTFKDC